MSESSINLEVNHSIQVFFFIPCSHILSIYCLNMDFGWHAFFKKPSCSFRFRVPPFLNSFVIPSGGFSDDHGRGVLLHGPLTFGRENNGIETV